MDGGGAHGEGVLELEVGFVEVAFLAAAVDAHDEGGGEGGSGRSACGRSSGVKSYPRVRLRYLHGSELVLPCSFD